MVTLASHVYQNVISFGFRLPENWAETVLERGERTRKKKKKKREMGDEPSLFFFKVMRGFLYFEKLGEKTHGPETILAGCTYLKSLWKP